MQIQARRTWTSRIVIPAIVAAVTALSAQTASQNPQRPQNPPVFTTTAELIRTEVRVRDKDGKFIPNLTPKDFEVFEDGVPQRISGFDAVIGGRHLPSTVAAPDAPKPRREGLILPPSAPPPDVSGRVFIIFVDDFHVQPGDTPRLKDALKQVRDVLIHENDMVGFVSSGYSAIEGVVSYDYKHRRFDEAINKAMGAGMTPDEIIKSNSTPTGPSGLNYRVHTAFQVVYSLLDQLAKITNRSKALIYVSSGYDMNPFTDSRYLEEQRKYSTKPEGIGGTSPGLELNDPDYSNPFEKGGNQFLETDLIADIAELINSARRANVVFYTLDPRGLVAANADINMSITTQEWMRNTRNTVSTLQILGDETGGFCICMQNNFKPGLQRIDNEMSDYYVIGYVSNNPDPTHIERKVQIKVNRPDVHDIGYISVYRLKKPSKKK